MTFYWVTWTDKFGTIIKNGPWSSERVANEISTRFRSGVEDVLVVIQSVSVAVPEPDTDVTITAKSVVTPGS